MPSNDYKLNAINNNIRVKLTIKTGETAVKLTTIFMSYTQATTVNLIQTRSYMLRT
jgi:hypothetical protein